MRNQLLPLLFLTLSLIACDRQNDAVTDCTNGTIMTLVDRTGLDGCGWMLQAGDVLFEPVNLGDFDTALQEDARYCVIYELTPNLASICMAGSMIRLESFQKLN